MEFVHDGPVMVWDESSGQYLSPATGGVLPPKTAAAYFRGMLDGLVSGCFVLCVFFSFNCIWLGRDGWVLMSVEMRCVWPVAESVRC